MQDIGGCLIHCEVCLVWSVQPDLAGGSGIGTGLSKFQHGTVWQEVQAAN